jgi:hypothetical protein
MIGVRPYSIIVQYSGQFYEVILWLDHSQMLKWDKEIDSETIHCICDMSHNLKHLRSEARGATPF